MSSSPLPPARPSQPLDKAQVGDHAQTEGAAIVTEPRGEEADPQAGNPFEQITTEQQARAYTAQLCEGAAMDRLILFAAKLAEENAHQNLVAKASLAHIWQRHIADSAQLLDLAQNQFLASYPDSPGLAPLVSSARPWLDLGSGAGLPGLVIAAMRPQWPVVLVESRRKRIEWLKEMVAVLELPHCQVEGQKLERITRFSAGVISARAFAPLGRLLNLSSPFSTADTIWVLPKGRSAAQDISKSPKRIRAMFHVEQSRTDPQAGILLGCGAIKTREVP